LGYSARGTLHMYLTIAYYLLILISPTYYPQPPN